MIQEIAQALEPLKGLPLWDAGRAADIIWLQLGAKEHAPTARNPIRVTGNYALHLQCPWRVSSNVGLVTGSDDLLLPRDAATPEWQVDATAPGGSLADARLQAWIHAYTAGPLIVEHIIVDRCNGFALQLTQGFAVEVLPTASSGRHDARELWRLLQPGRDTRHFVVEDQGILRA